MMATSFSNSKLGFIGKGTGLYAPSKEYTESKLVKDMINTLKKTFKDEPLVILNTHGGQYQRAGFPDLYIQLRGCAIWIEAKRPGGDTTALQKASLEHLYDAGAYVATCDTVHQVLDTVRHALALQEKRVLSEVQYTLYEEALADARGRA